MRKIASLFLVLIVSFLFGMSVSSWAIEDVSPAVDSQRAAQVFAGVELFSCEGNFNFDRWENGNFSDFIYGSFNYTVVAKMITYLEIRGEVIIGPDDKPRKGFLKNEVGETRNFWVWMGCFDTENNRVAYGSFNKDILFSEDEISMRLTPDWKYEFIPFLVPTGVNERDIAMVVYNSSSPEGSCCYNYQNDRGGFSGYFNPLEISNYEIKDISTGKVYATGTINPLAAVPTQQDDGQVINLVLPGGVTEVKFNGENDYKSFDRQKLDGQVTDCVEPPTVAPVYERVPLSTVEQILQMGTGRTLYKFRATAPVDADAQVSLFEFADIMWSNGGDLQLDFVSLYAYWDGNYSVPYTHLDPTGRVAPSLTAYGNWSNNSNERNDISFGTVEGVKNIMFIPSGTTLYFDLRADISGFVPAVGACAFIGTSMAELGEAVLYTQGGGCTESTVPISGGGMGAPSLPVIFPPFPSECLEETVPAKVYFMDLDGKNLNIYISGFTEGNVEVRRWVPTGEMPVIAIGDLVGNRYGNSVDVKSGYGKIVVVVTGTPWSPDDGFYISFSRQPANTGGGGMGGGKG